MNMYLDASAIIYGMEGCSDLRKPVLAWLTQVDSSGGAIITSRLSRLECRVRPLRESQSALLAQYEQFFQRQSLPVVDIGASVIELATYLRVRYGFKTPDAIHMATAMEGGVELVLTGDRDMTRCREIRVELV